MEFTLTKNGYTATFTTTGGELISFKNAEREYLWYGDPEYWAGHAPVLFPFVSALTDSEVLIDGKACRFKDKHGFARKFEYTVKEKGEDSVTFSLKENDVTLAQYPYNFELEIIHKLKDNGFETSYRVTNKDCKDIKFCIGGHPGFKLNADIKDYTFVFDKEENAQFYYTDENSHFSYDYKSDKKIEGRELNLTYSDFDRDALLCENLNSTSVTIIPKDGKGAFEFGFEGYPVLAIWTSPLKKAPFVCLEPWHGLPAFVGETGHFEDKPYMVKLSPGTSKIFTYTFKAL